MILYYSVAYWLTADNKIHIVTLRDKRYTECSSAPEQKQFPVRNTESHPSLRFNSRVIEWRTLGACL